MRIAWLTVVACAALTLATAAEGQDAALTAEDWKDLEGLQTEAADATRTDRALLAKFCRQMVDQIMKPDPVAEPGKKIEARESAIAAFYGGVGTAKGRVTNTFRDVAAEILRVELTTLWPTLSKTDWLGRMNVMMVVSAVANHSPEVMTVLQLGMDDPNPAVRYHAVKGLGRIRGGIAGSSIRAVADNRKAFLAALKARGLSEPNGVVRRLLHRVLTLQKNLPNPQNNVAVDLLLAVAKARLDLIAKGTTLPGIPAGLFFERADVELAKALGLSLAHETDASVKTRLATALARMITYAATDHRRAGLPEEYRLLLVGIMLVADDALVASIPGAPPLMRNALALPTLRERQLKAAVNATAWVLQHLNKAFKVRPVPWPTLPPYEQAPAATRPTGLPDDGTGLPEGGTGSTGTGTGGLPEGG